MVIIENKMVFSDEGKIVLRIGTEITAPIRRYTALPGDTPEDFEELDELPKYTKSEYDAKVAELVRSRYSESEEAGIQRKMINVVYAPETFADKAELAEKYAAEYAEYNAFVEGCKARAVEELTQQVDAPAEAMPE